MDIQSALSRLDLSLPPLPQAKGLYRSIVQTGPWLHTSGQLPLLADGSLLHKGKVGQEISVEQAQEAARQCILNALAWVDSEQQRNKANWALSVIKLHGFVNCGPDFTEHPKVLNGASELLAKLFGEGMVPARTAVGTNSLPLGSSVELDLVFYILD